MPFLQGFGKGVRLACGEYWPGTNAGLGPAAASDHGRSCPRRSELSGPALCFLARLVPALKFGNSEFYSQPPLPNAPHSGGSEAFVFLSDSHSVCSLSPFLSPLLSLHYSLLYLSSSRNVLLHQLLLSSSHCL